MGKRKNKNIIQESEEEMTVEKEEMKKEEDPAEDNELIPFHTRQASWAIIYLLFFSVLMFTLPFGAFYGTRHFLHVYFDIYGFQNNCWSVLAAVVTVNIVIAMYAIVGFLDAKKEEETVIQFSQNKTKKN